VTFCDGSSLALIRDPGATMWLRCSPVWGQADMTDAERAVARVAQGLVLDGVSVSGS
jgi:hypothetical protein